MFLQELYFHKIKLTFIRTEVNQSHNDDSLINQKKILVTEALTNIFISFPTKISFKPTNETHITDLCNKHQTNTKQRNKGKPKRNSTLLPLLHAPPPRSLLTFVTTVVFGRATAACNLEPVHFFRENKDGNGDGACLEGSKKGGEGS